MIYAVFLKNRKDGSPWKWWAIGVSDQKEVIVWFGAHNPNDIIKTSRTLDIQGKLPEDVREKCIDQKRHEGYVPYGEGQFAIDDNGKMTPVINQVQTAQLFGKPIVFASGNCAKDFDFSMFDSLAVKEVFEGVIEVGSKKNDSYIAYRHPDSQYEFSISFRYIQSIDAYKVDSQLKTHHPALSGLLLLYVDFLFKEAKNGKLRYSDVDSNELVIPPIPLLPVTTVFNFGNVANFKEHLEALGMVKQVFSGRNLVKPLMNAVAF